MVDRSLVRLEWEKPYQMAESRHSDRIRCFPDRMGSNIEWDQHRWPVEAPGKTLAHKLLGDPSGQSSSTNLLEEPIQRSGATATGQYHSSVLYQSSRGHSIPPSDMVSEESLAMMPETEYFIKGTTPSREGKCYSRPGIQSDERPVRLDAEPRNIQQATEVTGNRDTPVCIPSNQPASPILQLETRPSSSSNRCLLAGLVEHGNLCQPTMELDRQSPNKTASTRKHTDVISNPTMAITAMVPSTAGPSNRLATPPPREGGPDVADMGGNITRGNTQTSRVAYLKQSYFSQKNSQSRLHDSYCHHGKRNRPNHMTHCLKSGFAGVKNGIQIPLLPL